MNKPSNESLSPQTLAVASPAIGTTLPPGTSGEAKLPPPVSIEVETLPLPSLDTAVTTHQASEHANSAVISSNYSIRPAREEDIPTIVDVDLRSFDSVYQWYQEDPANLREQLQEKFLNRFRLVGGDWMPVLELEGDIVGFMTSCPTSKRPEDFESWEKTSDNGTLGTTYDPDGENVYVVTLSVLEEGKPAKDMLFAHQIGKMLREGYKLGYFESRMPGFREWVVEQLGSETAADVLTSEQENELANNYFALETDHKGRPLKVDRLLQRYQRVGCKLLRVVPNAYQDHDSMDYGVVCVYDGASLFDGSDLPFRIPENRFTRWCLGVAMQAVARSPKLARKLLA